MKHPVIVGLQFGDEGKGKITDCLASQSQWVIRYNGGNNAGHTLWHNGKKLVTHSVPSGILYPNVKNYIGSGCVLDPLALNVEFEDIEAAGVQLSPEILKIDFRTHLTFPIHVALDKARESGLQNIGTTQRGIGPVYASKAERLNIRAEDLLEPRRTEGLERLKKLHSVYSSRLKFLGAEESAWKETEDAFNFAAKKLAPYVSTKAAPFYEAAKKDKCLLEGAQALMLDVDHGTYPYVTSSHTAAPYAAVGAPFPFQRIGAIIGVAKAYLTRVGTGPMETELENEVGERLRKNGAEFGATTGRPRRIGWLNLDELKNAAHLSSCTHIALTKADILTGEDFVGVWKESKLHKLDSWSQLSADKPFEKSFEEFLSFIEEYTELPVAVVGTGADREAIVWRVPSESMWATN